MPDGFSPYWKGGQPGKTFWTGSNSKEKLILGIGGSLSGKQSLDFFKGSPFGIGKGAQGLSGVNPGFAFPNGQFLPIIIHKNK